MLSLIVPLVAAFFVVRCISRATVGAEDRGHLDTLLSLPVSRRVVVAASFVVAGIALGAILATFWRSPSQERSSSSAATCCERRRAARPLAHRTVQSAAAARRIMPPDAEATAATA